MKTLTSEPQRPTPPTADRHLTRPGLRIGDVVDLQLPRLDQEGGLHAAFSRRRRGLVTIICVDLVGGHARRHGASGGSGAEIVSIRQRGAAVARHDGGVTWL